MKKRILYFVLPILILISLISVSEVFAGTATLSFEAPATAQMGGELVLRVKMNLSGMLVGGYDAVIVYDRDYLTYQQTRSIYKPTGADNDITDTANGLLCIYGGLDASSAVQTGETQLYEIVFSVKDNIPEKTVLFSFGDVSMCSESAVQYSDSVVSKTSASTSISSAGTGDATLSSLTYNGGTAVTGFSPSVTNYTLNVANNVTSITLSGTPNDATSAITSSPVTNASLSVGSNNFSITVTAQSGVTKTYYINVVRAGSSDNNLSSIGISAGTLSPSFNSATLSYTVNVPYTQSSIVLSASTASSLASLIGTGEKSLAVGSNVFGIVVTAQDGSQKTYSVSVNRAAASSNAKLSGITVNGTLVSGFSSNTNEYFVTLPNTTDSATVVGTCCDSTATIISTNYADEPLTVGENVFDIIVQAQDASTTETYTVVITRSESSDTSLSYLSINVNGNVQMLNPMGNSLTAIVPYTVESITVSATATDGGATVSGTGTRSLNVGLNAVSVVVTAQDGTVKTYTINVTRNSASGNSKLGSFSASVGTLTSYANQYNVFLQYNQASTVLEFEAGDSTATVSPSSPMTVTLLAGETRDITITVTAQDLSESEYTIRITRESPNDDATLSRLAPVGDFSFNETFDADTTEYTVSVPYDTDSIMFDFETNSQNASTDYSCSDAFSLTAGVPTEIVITVTAEDGTTQKAYTITATRELCSDNTLSMLAPSLGELLPEFDPSVTEYELELPYSVDELSFTFTKNHSTAVAEIEEPETLEVGVNLYVITVTAQDGFENQYVIRVTRKAASDVNTLKSLKPSSSRFVEVFSSSRTIYTMTVPYTTETISFLYTVTDETATVEVTGNETLIEGRNTYEITVTAENGDENIYTVNVTRTAASQVNTFKKLETEAGRFDQSFMPSRVSYTMTVPYSVSTIDFTYAMTNAFATVDFIGSHNLSVGENLIQYKVTAQNGAERVYSITVTRAEPSTDSKLKSITPSAGKLLPGFSGSITEYNITVGYNVETISFVCEACDERANIEISGDGNLIVNGKNVFTITVTAENGNCTVYRVNVFRQQVSDNTRLDYIRVAHASIDFNPTVYSYNVTVPYGYSTAEIEFATESEAATAVLSGNTTLHTDRINNFSIAVTAENGARAVYEIHITYREIETDSSLATLTDSFGLIDFKPEQTTYDITVPYSSDDFKIEYTLSGKFATAEALFPEYLKISSVNTFTILVTSESGNVTLYRVNVTRAEMSKDSTLSKLEIEGLEGLLEFDAKNTEYDIRIPYSVSEIKLVYETNNRYATAVVTEPEELTAGKTNEYQIKVTAENGTKTVYKLNIYRENISHDSTLSSLSCGIKGLTPAFSPNVTDYTVTVPYSVERISVDYTLSDKYATATKSGNAQLSIGENVFEIVVTAEDNTTSTYKLTVTRLEKDTNSHLSKLVPSVGEIEFDENTLEYYIELENKYDSINFDYETASEYAIAKITGSSTLSVGKNEEFRITVTAESGDVTVYKITVFRKALSSNKNISKITVNGRTIDISLPEYKVYFDYTVTTVEVKAQAEDEKSRVLIQGNGKLEVGTNRVVISVIAEDETTKDYVVEVLRDKGSSNAFLSELTFDNAELGEAFDKNKTEYSFTVSADIAELAMNAVAEDELSAVSVSRTLLNFGENEIFITVTSQNGTENIYTLLVTREEETFGHFLTTRVIFSIGKFNVTAGLFFLGTVLIIGGCGAILILLARKKKK